MRTCRQRLTTRAWLGGLAVCATLSLSAPPAMAVNQSFTEDFTTTTYRDAVNTTAVWDTTTSELKLPPFVISLAGAYDTPGSAIAVAVAGDHAFVADGAAGLQVIDISDPTAPTLAGTYDTSGHASGVAVAGNHAFVADGAAGVQVIDISDPTTPALAGSFDTAGSAVGVAVAGDHAFVADGAGGLKVIDVSDPTTPTLAGSYDTPDQALGVAVAGDHAYVADNTSGVQVIDITDPTTPTLAGSFDTSSARDISVAGDHAFVADSGAGLVVVDISDPTAPALAGSYDTPGSARGVTLAGNHAYVADRAAGLQVIDISDPTAPALVGSYDTADEAVKVAVAGEHAFVADSDSGLQVIDIYDRTNPVLVGSNPLFGSEAVAVAGDHAFVANRNLGLLQVVDISDLTNPTLVGSYATPSDALSVAVAGDHAFVADRTSGLQVIDVSDPTNPTLAGSVNTPQTARDVVVAGDHAFLGTDSGLQVIDVSDPTNPTLAGSLGTPPAFGVAVAGDHAFLSTLGFFAAIDISDPDNPVSVGSLNEQALGPDVAVSGDYAFVVDLFADFRVIDISDPTNPTLAGSLAQIALDVAVAGNLAFLADPAALQVIDISDPTNPMNVGSHNAPGVGTGVAVAGDHVLVTTDNGGFRSIRIAQSEVAAETGVGQSLEVDGGSEAIVRARLTTTQTANVTWEVSVDGAANFMPITPDGSWLTLGPGDDLRWRSMHVWSPGLDPTVSDLTLDWLSEHGPIVSVGDLPDDQGGWLRLVFCRSGYDFADEANLPVTGYQVYRRVDSAPLQQRLLDEGTVPSRADRAGSVLASFEVAAVRRLEDRSYVIGDVAGAAAQGEFPPGTWELLSFHAATQQNAYTVAVPTLADSTGQGGVAWSVHFVSTHTTTPSVWFASPPDSGYSVDNIAPTAPANLVFEEPTVLAWDPAPEADFHYHTVYGSASPDFDETATLIDHTVAPTYDVSAAPFAYYHVTTSDDADNESSAASITSPTVSVEPAATAPHVFALHAPSPNPLRSSTTIAFDLPRASEVELRVFDASGRQVRLLAHGPQRAGRHTVAWDGRNETGARAAAGVYFARLESGHVRAHRRIVLIR